MTQEMWLESDFYNAFWDVYDTIHLARIQVGMKRVDDDIAHRRTYRWYPDCDGNDELKQYWFVCGRCEDGNHGECLNDYYNDTNCACDHVGGINELRVRTVP